MGTPTYDLYIDDSGTRLPDRRASERRDDGIDAFALGGFLVESEGAPQAVELHKEFIQAQGLTYPLHSNPIRCKKGNFRWLANDESRAKQFYAELSRLLLNAPGLLIACVVHRPGYNSRYVPLYGAARWMLCKSAYAILVERAAKYAHSHGRRLRVYIESSGKREDRILREYHRELATEGMPFQPQTSHRYSPLCPEALRAILMKNPQFIKKTNPLAQLADLVLYPVVKGGYEQNYQPYRLLKESGKLIDAHVADPEILGIKYYCFDG